MPGFMLVLLVAVSSARSESIVSGSYVSERGGVLTVATDSGIMEFRLEAALPDALLPGDPIEVRYDRRALEIKRGSDKPKIRDWTDDRAFFPA